MRRDPAYLLDILNSSVQAVEYLNESTLEEFLHETLRQDAVIRRIEIIGEAAGKISQEMIAAHPELPWREMKLMRNLLIHEYADVDIHEVWRTVKTDLPPLITALTELISKI